MKSVKNRILAVTAAAVMSCVGAANAMPITDNLASLQSLGGSIGIGDKVFSGFTYNNNGLTSFNASGIKVTASIDSDGIYYLTWTGNMGLFTGGTLATADLELGYTVTANSGFITMIDQSYTGRATGGTLSVVETAKVGIVVVGTSTLDPADLSDPAAESNDILLTGPQTHLNVVKDLTFAVTSDPNALVNVSEVTQSFHQNNVPDGGTTVLLLGAALSAFGLLRKKLIA